ncbi:tyrosine-type recombinase/integrase [uncultured Pseudoteredinibacter sp.]|uniref:tyrosine-type recombinase/integrase n=1 Tax=uncultured Pseudoteredinibacter sp. TaxID=1641701 RepID=UPI00262B8141|nr:tyrosine-type recombinase/integrase [uncultured Pseudoteredinibacter sp.]
MPLVDVQVREARSREKDYKLADGEGMYLLVKKGGQKYWRLDYRFHGKRKTLALGVYPRTSLKSAREKRQEAKLLLDGHKDPSAVKRQEKFSRQLDCFEDVARQWWLHQKGLWTENHAKRVLKRLEDNVFSDLGSYKIDDITPQQVIATIRKVESRGALDVANRVKQAVNATCRFAVQQGIATRNPAGDLQGIVKQRTVKHRPSLPRDELPGFLKALDSYDVRGRQLTQLAIKLLVSTFVRSGELRGAKWDEFDLDSKVWRIPSARMKMKNEHIVPLSEQSIVIIQSIKNISGAYDLLFPSERDRRREMSDNTMRRAIFKLGYDGETPGKSKAVPHGFRATASSILNESGFNPDAIERQLAHKETNSVRSAYTHHARYLSERVDMMQWWSDYLDKARLS